MNTARKLQFIMICILLPSSSVFGLDMLPAGESLPDFKLLDVTGIQHSTNDLLGSPHLLIYVRLNQSDSQSLIRDCLLWMSEMQGLKVLSFTDIPSATPDNSAIPLLIDTNREVYGTWGVRVFPSIVQVDRNGIVVKTKAGYGQGAADQLHDDLEVLLGMKTAEESEAEQRDFRVEKSADGTAVRYFQAGKKLWDDGFDERAQAEWLKAVEEDSTYVEARIYLARYYYRKEQPTSARRHLEAVQEKAESAEVYELIARCFIDEGDLENAEDAAERALDINRRSFEAKLTLAEIYLLQGDAEEAEYLIQEVLMLKKGDPRALYLRGRLAEVQGDLSGAVKFYRQALEKQIDAQ